MLTQGYYAHPPFGVSIDPSGPGLVHGLLFAASSFVVKSVSGFSILAAPAIIGATRLRAGSDPSTAPPSAMNHLTLIYAPTMTGPCAVAPVLMPS